MPRIFLSYSHRDEARVQALYLLLGSLQPQPVFLATRSIRPGQRWRDELRAALAGCEVLLVMWGRHAAASDWVRREIGWAAELGKTILPFRLDATPLDEGLAPWQAIDAVPLADELLALHRELDQAGITGAARAARVDAWLLDHGVRDRQERTRLGAATLTLITVPAFVWPRPLQRLAELADCEPGAVLGAASGLGGLGAAGVAAAQEGRTACLAALDGLVRQVQAGTAPHDTRVVSTVRAATSCTDGRHLCTGSSPKFRPSPRLRLRGGGPCRL